MTNTLYLGCREMPRSDPGDAEEPAEQLHPGHAVGVPGGGRWGRSTWQVGVGGDSVGWTMLS